jgi:nucleoside-diphosphate-sugar epimerase
MQRLLIIGSGDVARRALPELLSRYRVLALVRTREQADRWREAGATPLLADLDNRHSLTRLAALARSCTAILHLAPPPANGERDSRTRHLLAALAPLAALNTRQYGKNKSLTRRLVYVSTTGVYGDCQGAWIDETRPRRAENARARRRVDAENALRQLAPALGWSVAILRAPGIYAAERLPIERLQRGTPALVAEADVFTNHIHADDLACACIAAVRRGRSNRAYNVVDDSDLKMADYFDLVADRFDLPRPPRLPRADLEKVLSPVQLSFMRESRRIGNRRLKTELGVRLGYPVVEAVLGQETAKVTKD